MTTNDAQPNTNSSPLQEVRVDIGDLNNGNEFNHAHGAPNPGAPNHRVGAVRDRLFHAMVVKIAVSYSSFVPYKWRRLIEFSVLLIALSMLGTLIYVHYVYSRYPGTCLNDIKERWPRKGVLRVEVISNLKQFEAQFYEGVNGTTKFTLRDILMHGPKAIPEEARSGSILSTINFDFANNDDIDLSDNDLVEINPTIQPVFTYVVEYSLYHGLLKLPAHLRRDYKIEQMLYRIDGENDFCLLSWSTRFFTRYLIGVDDVIMSSLKALAENDTEKGFLRDLLTGEHYHFVTTSVSKVSYLSAMLIMLLFTFAVSMLLRFSHHQIFLFILDLLQMFELNEPLVFPIAPLLTVILALVGIEAIMSEVFNDTSTAFYIILLVWMADQYDAICCRSAVSRRHWLRFFYLYHWAFYVYNYKYSGQYNVFALLTSSMFILHAMIFFFHHYEIPLIIHQELLVGVLSTVHQETRLQGNAADFILINRGSNLSTRRTTQTPVAAQEASDNPVVELTTTPTVQATDIRPLVVNVSTQNRTVTSENSTRNVAHRSITFSRDLSPETTVAQSVPNTEAMTMQSNTTKSSPHEESTSVPQTVANEIVQSVMDELFDRRQLEEYQ